MNPKKYSEFKKGIAEEVGVHSQLVDDFVTFYYGKQPMQNYILQKNYGQIFLSTT